MHVTTFSAQNVRNLRNQIRKAKNEFGAAKLQRTQEDEEVLAKIEDKEAKTNMAARMYFIRQMKTNPGWSKGDNELLAAHLKIAEPILRVREGYRLAYYQNYGVRDGSSIMYALPTGMELPDPNKAPIGITPGYISIPVPEEANVDFMIAIQGDESPKSYLMASILRRELAEIGAVWHSISWGMEIVLDCPPWQDLHLTEGKRQHELPTGEEGTTFVKERPQFWEPRAIRFEDGGVAVQFYSYTVLGGERIVLNEDVYRQGEYQHTTRQEEIATGRRVMYH